MTCDAGLAPVERPVFDPDAKRPGYGFTVDVFGIGDAEILKYQFGGSEFLRPRVELPYAPVTGVHFIDDTTVIVRSAGFDLAKRAISKESGPTTSQNLCRRWGGAVTAALTFVFPSHLFATSLRQMRAVRRGIAAMIRGTNSGKSA